MLAAKAQGVDSIYVTDKIDERLAIATKEGAVFTGNPLKEDVVAEYHEEDKSWDLI